MGNALVLNKDFKIVMSNSMVKGKQDVLTLWQHILLAHFADKALRQGSGNIYL